MTHFIQSLISRLPLGLILVWLLTLPAITPFFQPTLPRSADGLLHLYRVVALDAALQQGSIFPRWLPDLAYGYGQPLFVFYAPLAYYLTEGLHWLGLDFVTATNTSFSLALLVAGSGMYLFIKERLGPQAALLAGVAYAYAPAQLVNALVRGSLPAVWAAAIVPFAFWTVTRLKRRGQPGDILLSALFIALALIIHNISSLIFFPLLIVYLLLEWLFFELPESPWSDLSPPREIFKRTGLALILGLGLSAFFWLPAVLEKEFVQIERVITPPDFDYRAHFLSLGDLFSFPPPANTGLLNPDFPATLGLAHVGLALLGLIFLFWSFTKRRQSNAAAPQRLSAAVPLLLLALTGLAGAIFMMLPLSTPVWNRLPLLPFIQHPGRLLIATAFLLAILTGVTVAAAPPAWRVGLTAGGILLIFLSAAPLLYPGYHDPLPAPPTLAGMMTYERSIGAIGTTSFGEYLPRWVEQRPQESPLEPFYRSGAEIERLDQAALPPEAVIQAIDYGFNRVELTLDTPQPTPLRFHTFYFPGWQAQVDGQPVAVAPVTERGLIGLEMPAGQHHLRLLLADTQTRLVANGISLLTGALLILILIGDFRPQPSYYPPPAPASAPKNMLPLRQVAIFTSLAIGLLLLKLLYLDRFDSPFKHTFDGRTLPAVDVSQPVNFGHQLTLLGYNLDARTKSAGESFDLTLFWQAQQPLTIDYSILAQLVDAEQHLYGGQDNLHPGGLPTSRWPLWTFTQDPHTVPVPPGTPPGDYFLITGPYQPRTWQRLPVVTGGEPGWVDVLPIPVTVTKPNRPPPVAALGITWPVEATLTPALNLLGATPEREALLRNDFLRIALFWEALSQPEKNYQVQLHLRSADGTVVLERTSQPSHGRYPTTRWVAGERVRDNHTLWIPPDFPAGEYEVTVRLLSPGEAGQPVILGRLRVIE